MTAAPGGRHGAPDTVESPSISLRPLRRSDFAMLGRWLAEPLVHRWWHHETSPAAVERDFGPSVDGADATELFVAATDGRDVGLLQRYPVAAYQEYVDELSAVCTVPAGALSLDYLIGEPAARGRGVGAAMIAALVAASWSAYPDACDILVPVSVGNLASWRALERVGFTRIAEGEMEPDNPQDPRDHYVYRLQRPQRCSRSTAAPPAPSPV